jgi:hypothetical protein
MDDGGPNRPIIQPSNFVSGNIRARREQRKPWLFPQLRPATIRCCLKLSARLPYFG